MRHLSWIVLLAASGCHLVFSYTSAGTNPDASPDLDRAAAEPLDHPRQDLPKRDTKDAVTITSPVDILVVVDNSNSMEPHQAALTLQFAALIDALKLGGSTLPDLHIGVVSTDLGAGSYGVPTCEVPGGDGGKLSNTPRVPLCMPPTDPWISHTDGATNVPSGSSDPAQRVKDAFACIAALGTGGCAFEQPLEAARKALDPGPNPGFLRPGALLAVLFLTNEDDCSATTTTLFEQATTTYGPLVSYRCTRFGLVCDQLLTTTGIKTNCVPGQSLLHPIAGYVAFFKGLKPAGQVFVAAIAGPASPVEVHQPSTSLELKPSCNSVAGTGAPAVRIKAVVDGMGSTGIFNLGVDAQNKLVDVNVCGSDYSPVMKLLGLKLAGAI